MKKYLFFILLGILLVQPISFLVAKNSKLVYPVIYNPFDLIDKTRLEKKDKYINLLFTPLGWSKDGKIAYIIGIDPGGAGFDETGYYSWVIQDMVTDKLEWQSEHGLEEGLPTELKDEFDPIKILKWVYANHSKKYQKNFDKYKIICDKNIKIQKFPFIYNSNEFYGKITDIYRETKYSIPDIITKYKVMVLKNNVRKVCSQKNNDFLLDIQVVGYIKSPFEPRIAIVISNIMWGWEGPPHRVWFSLIGCDLEKGF